MLKIEIDNFFEDYLQGAFPTWKPTPYEESFWMEKLVDVSFMDAKEALKNYYEKETFARPKWNKYKTCLLDVEQRNRKPIKNEKKIENYITVQCIAHNKIKKLGSQLVFVQPTPPQNYEIWEEVLIEDIIGVYGGIWEVVAAGIASQRNIIAKQTIANNPQLNPERRMYYLDELLPDNWQPADIETAHERRRRVFFEPKAVEDYIF